jgi:succinyl-diaminopimelate desuccinylase
MNSPASNPVANLQTLIRCPSVTPDEGGALAAIEAMLAPLGFEIHRPVFSEDGTPSVENLYARLGSVGPHLMFAGHTDVVPVGDESAWTHAPFSADIADGQVYGRGAVDMKGGVACFIAAIARQIEKHGLPTGSVSFLITGDEEGPAVNGSAKLLEWAKQRGETWDACVLGEPTNPEALGDMIKIGRRGSLSGTITVSGKQGHAAYPHLADNPVRSLVQIAEALLDPSFDNGTENFQATNLEITTIDTGNPAVNVIPAKSTLSFNVRFNDSWSPESLRAEIEKRVDAAAGSTRLRPGKSVAANYRIAWKDKPSHVFLTRDETLIGVVRDAVTSVTGKTPELSTSGGTSDARFIKDYCPVVEFGLVGKTMHMVDEHVAVDDLETLTAIYARIIEDWFSSRS